LFVISCLSLLLPSLSTLTLSRSGGGGGGGGGGGKLLEMKCMI